MLADGVRIAQPQVAGPLQAFIGVLQQCVVLGASYLIDGSSKMLRDMKLVEADLLLHIRYVGNDRIDIGRPHIHRDGSNPRALVIFNVSGKLARVEVPPSAGALVITRRPACRRSDRPVRLSSF